MMTSSAHARDVSTFNAASAKTNTGIIPDNLDGTERRTNDMLVEPPGRSGTILGIVLTRLEIVDTRRPRASQSVRTDLVI